jgi:predicted ABC-type transport system involved in lysophospholipase L1 biosynthesis ATPase subunit
MTEPKPILELKNVRKQFPSPDGPPLVVLGGVTLTVTPGQSLAITGPSGSGKSTLLNIIGALERPDGGSVLLDGADLAALDDKALAAVRNRRIGFVFQLHHLLPQCTCLENVLVPTLAGGNGKSQADLRRRAERLLARVGLGERMHYRPGQLSGGERQRCAVVRALINEPAVLLADEPTGALDRASAENLADLLLELNGEEGVTLIVVTHWPELAARMALRYELRAGALAAAGKNQ